MCSRGLSEGVKKAILESKQNVSKAPEGSQSCLRAKDTKIPHPKAAIGANIKRLGCGSFCSNSCIVREASLVQAFVFSCQGQKPKEPFVSQLKASNGSLKLNKVRTEFNCPFVIQILVI